MIFYLIHVMGYQNSPFDPLNSYDQCIHSWYLSLILIYQKQCMCQYKRNNLIIDSCNILIIHSITQVCNVDVNQ